MDAFNFDSVIRALVETQSEVVVNCLGIIKQSSQAKDPFTSIYLNAPAAMLFDRLEGLMEAVLKER